MNLIISNVLVVTAIGGILALLLVLAEMIFANYGECKIDINGGKKVLSVQGGGHLLGALADNKLFIPSACGGRGSCGYCKVKVLEGAGPVLPTEKPYLTAQELAGNIRLSCQIKVKNDIQIEIPPELFAIRQFKARVSEIVDYTYDIKGVTFDLLEPDTIEFKAGQYVQLRAPKYGKVRESVSRAYSISSHPEDNRRLQLIIRLVPEGILTTWVHQHMHVGDEVSFTGPFGDFFIRDTDADMFFIAGGSGKAPIKSMVEHLKLAGSQRRMVYFFGARTMKDLYLTEEFRGFEQDLHDFTFVPVLSQPEEGSGWAGRTGYVLPYFQEFLRDPAKTEAYLCGSPGMLNAAVKKLKELGIPDENIFFDSFA